MSEDRKYRIGEVARLLNLETYVLRFWEGKFPQIDPYRTESGQRYYTENQVSLIRKIQQLLHEQGMTIAGARRFLEEGYSGYQDSPDYGPKRPNEFMRMLEQELTALQKLLAGSGDQ